MSSSDIPSKPRWKALYTFFGLALILRCLSLIPSIIDDDEAWFSASAAALQHPLSYFQQALDNKPPGTAWFYWITQHLIDPFHGVSSPRFARFIFIIGIALTALGIGRIVLKIRGSRESAHLAALLFLIASVLPFPKLFAVTNEGLMLPLITAAVLMTIRAREHPLKSAKIAHFVGAGASLACATLIKQTGVFFFLPILALTGVSLEFALVLGAFLVVLGAAVVSLGAQDFIYWVLIYPAHTLVQAREKLFSGWADGMINLGWFGFTLIPLLANIAWRQTGNRVLWAWLIASTAAIVLGRGLFLHYFLLLLPPLCIFVALSSNQILWGRWQKLWMGVGYALTSIFIALPISGIFWGTDLPYYSRLSARIRSLTKPDEKIFIWGGNAMPLAMSERISSSRFVVARLLTPPYATENTPRDFEEDFMKNPPSLVVDIHERGDNQFNFPIESYPWLKGKLELQYTEWRDPALPWVSFYFVKSPSNAELAKTAGLCASESILKTPGFDVRSLMSKLSSKTWYATDLLSRSWYSLHFLAESCPKEHVDLQRITTQLADPSPSAEAATQISDEVLRLYNERGHAPPFPLESRGWWVSLALVTLQPVALPR